jgi:hydrogenase expression/formation protein HypC
MCLGVPGQIIDISDRDNLLGTVSISGVRRVINLVCIVDDAHPIDTCVGDWVLVHVGFAMSRIDEQEAARTLQLLTELGELQQDVAAMQQAAEAVSQ